MRKKETKAAAWQSKYEETIGAALGRLEAFEMTYYTHYYVQDADFDMIRPYANGYQTTTGDYEGIHILQTLDLRRIYFEDRAATYRFAAWCQAAIAKECF